MADDVVAFLRAALDEVERVAGAAERARTEKGVRAASPWHSSGSVLVAAQRDGSHDDVAEVVDYQFDAVIDHAALHDPRAALARVQAERVVLHDYERAWAEYARQDGGVSPAYLSGQMTGAYSAVIALAHGHRHTVPGYDPAWAPEGVSADA